MVFLNRIVTTYYVRDPQGNVLAVYEHKHGDSDNGTFTLTEQHLYGAGRLGMRKRDLALNVANASESTPPVTHYELTNHLGNVMAVISDKASSTNEPTVVSLSDYYPYGMTEPGRSYSESDDYRYGYTGHEKENDLAEGVYITEYRLLDTRLGKWMSVDPLYAKYADMSSYNYCHNNPIVLVDPNGETDVIHKDPENDNKYQTEYIDDGVNQVVEVQCEEWDALLNMGFDSSNELYKETIEKGMVRKDINPTISNVLAGKEFIGYDYYDFEEKYEEFIDTDGIRKKRHVRNCNRLAKTQNNQTASGGNERIDLYDIYSETESAFDFKGGVSYVKEQLESGNSVVVGIHYKGGEKTGNTNKSTGHFLNIVGMGFDLKDGQPVNYFSYYDNATTHEMIGTDLIGNRFYFSTLPDKTEVLMDKTGVVNNGGTTYIMSEVRINKGKKDIGDSRKKKQR